MNKFEKILFFFIKKTLHSKKSAYITIVISIVGNATPSFFVCKSYDNTKYDAALLVGISEEKYSEYMEGVTTVHKNIDLNSMVGL